MYPSYRWLKITLGRIDAVAAFSELSVRELLAHDRGSDRSGYLRSLADRHHINLTHVDLDLLPLRNTQVHLVSVHQVFMEFLDMFRHEHPSSTSWDPRLAGEPWVEYIWKNVLGSKNAGTAEEKVEFDLVEYYRLMRNRFVHAIGNKPPKFENLRHAVKSHAALSKLDGPNEYRELKFDDIIIFARSALGVANTVCQKSIPTETEVVSMVRDSDGRRTSARATGFRLKDYRKFKDNQPRLRQAIATLLNSLYGIEPSSSVRIVEDLASGLLA